MYIALSQLYLGKTSEENPQTFSSLNNQFRSRESVLMIFYKIVIVLTLFYLLSNHLNIQVPKTDHDTRYRKTKIDRNTSVYRDSKSTKCF